MDTGGFRQAISDFLSPYNLLHIADYGGSPVALFMGATLDGYRIETHWEVFPWSSMRNRLVAAVTYFKELQNEAHVTVYMPKPEDRFLEHVAKYGVIRRVGTKHDFPKRGDTSAEYETRRLK